MASGNELVLGFMGLSAVTAALVDLGIDEIEFEGFGEDRETADTVRAKLSDLEDPKAEDNWLNWDLDDLVREELSLSPIGEKIREAYLCALGDAGFKVLSETSEKVLAETPEGERRFQPWVLELHQDLDTKEIFLILSLSSRYRPVFCDWKNENGTLNPIVFNAELQGVIDIAKKHLFSAWPYLKNADLMVLEI